MIKAILELDMKFKDNLIIDEITMIIKEAITNASLLHHVRMLNIAEKLEESNTSIESKSLIEHHTAWIELLKKAKTSCEVL